MMDGHVHVHVHVQGKKELMVDQEQIEHYHLPYVCNGNGGQCSCVFDFLLSIMDVDPRRMRAELAKRMLSSAGQVVTSKGKKRPLEAATVVVAAAKKVKTGGRRAAMRIDHVVTDTLRALKEGDAVAAQCRGHHISGVASPEIEEEKEDASCTKAHDLVEDRDSGVFYPRDMARGGGSGPHIGEFRDMIDEFRVMIDVLVSKIRLRIGDYPDTAVFYDPESTTVAFYAPSRRRVFLNLGHFDDEMSQSDAKMVWFNVLIHELAHVTVSKHNAAFARAVQGLTARFVVM